MKIDNKIIVYNYLKQNWNYKSLRDFWIHPQQAKNALKYLLNNRIIMYFWDELTFLEWFNIEDLIKDNSDLEELKEEIKNLKLEKKNLIEWISKKIRKLESQYYAKLNYRKRSQEWQIYFLTKLLWKH